MLKLVNSESIKDSSYYFGTKRPSLSYLLNDTNCIYVKSLLKFAEYFKITADDLVANLEGRFGITRFDDHFRSCFWEKDIYWFARNREVPYFHPFDLFMMKHSAIPFMVSFVGEDCANKREGGQSILSDWVFLENRNILMGDDDSFSDECDEYRDSCLFSHKEKYHIYLQSEEWKQKRNTVIEKAGHKCQVCNSAKELQVHHRTYERIFKEDLSDLIVLCSSCHKKFHNIS